MTVSHYLVSGVQVVGLIVGLYGFFYLSTGILGKESVPWLRGLLPVSGLGLCAVLLAVAFTALIPGMSHLPPLEDGLAVLALLAMLSVFYFQVARYPDAPLEGSGLQRQAYRFHFILSVIGTVLLVSYMGQIVYNATNGIHWNQHNSAQLVAELSLVLGIWSFFGGMWLSRILSERRLTMLGFGLSVIAIITQFIPSVLDLLNIAVK